MHLDNRLSGINTKKRNITITKAKRAELELRWRKHNKSMKQKNMHHMRYETLDDYIDYCFGRITRPDPRDYRNFTKLQPEKSYAQKQIEEFNKKYPSTTMTKVQGGDGTGENAEWQKEKLKISSSYTVAPAYNKGAYQVVPKNEVKHIGK
tara:strand:- start:160 stop:609 length:450 start_codon:yes stop_codon:yes gene_type:complete